MKKSILVIAGLALAASVLAQLSKYKDWDKSPEAYFLTPEERTEWKSVANDADAEKFIGLYWAKRDPSPGTPQNEFRDEIGRRIAAADSQFKMPRYKRGADSVRGRLLIVLGTPTHATQQPVGNQEAPAIQEEGGFQPAPAGQDGRADAEVVVSTWTYEKDKLAAYGLQPLRARVMIDSRRGVDTLQNSSEVEKAIATVAQKSIANPNPAAPAAASASATTASAPPAASAAAGAAKAPAAPSATTAAAPAPAAAPVAALPAAAKSALQALDAKAASDASFWSGAFRTSAGESFLALQFYLPGDKPSLSAPALDFGAVVTDSGGQEVATLWEPASLGEVMEGTRKDRFYDRSIVLPPGSYKGTFGLFASESQPPVASSSISFQLPAKSTEFEVSPLLLGNSIVPLTKRPALTDPFVFGSDKPMKVDPKGDRRFSKQDSLWYFYAVSNPGVPPPPTPTEGAPPATPAKPRVQHRINVQLDGHDQFAPFTGPADLQQLGDAYYVTGSEIPLASFEPGYYTFLVHVRDLNAPTGSPANKGIDRQQDFVVLMPDGSLPQKKTAAPAPAPTKKKTGA